MTFFAVNVGTLFRGSELVSILLAKLARFVGQDYLISCVSPLVEMILRHAIGRRLDVRYPPLCVCVCVCVCDCVILIIPS